MRILFVCKGNAGRSQIAEAVFDEYSKTKHSVFSAGTHVYSRDGVSEHGRKLHEFETVREVLTSLKEMGIDVREKVREQLTEQMADSADIIVLITDEHVPDYLKDNPKVRHWNIQDPKGMNQEETNKIRDEIISHVEELIDEIDPAERNL